MTSTRTFENYNGGDYAVYVDRGMERFRAGRVDASVSDFDRAISLKPRLAPYMWQRGLSLYYADRFEDGAAQFRKDIAVNPNDTEEAIWAFLCDAKTKGVGFEAARKRLSRVRKDRRAYMRAAYALFAGESDEKDLALYIEGRPNASDSAPFFYANLYLGLYAEARGDENLARNYISAAAKCDYGTSGDYMFDLARVHKLVRQW